MTDQMNSGAAATRLVISDGGLPGLVAAAIASEETVRRENLGKGTPLIWTPTRRGAAVQAATRHAAALGIRVATPAEGAGIEHEMNAVGDAATRLLLDAGLAALDAASPVVVWPVTHAARGSDRLADVETIADAVNRATLVGRLISLDALRAGVPEVRIETPFVDLTDDQLAELACDLGVRFEDCWWWRDDSSAASVERARWGPLLPVPA